MTELEKVRLIPITSVLSAYNVPMRKRSDTQFVCNCPLPSHTQSSHRDTFSIGIGKHPRHGGDVWLCHSTHCQNAGNHKGGDVVDLVARLEHCDLKKAIKRLSDLFGAGESERGVNIPSPSEAAKPEKNVPLAFTLKSVEPDHPFIRERGLTVETIMEYGAGVFTGKGTFANRVVFPIHEDGDLIGYIGRTILPVSEDNPKWLLPRGIHRTFVYGIEKCDPEKPLVLVESPWGVLWLHQKGIQAAALLGHTMTEAQEKRLEPFHTIFVAMDDDEPGREATEKLAARLRPNHKVVKSRLME